MPGKHAQLTVREIHGPYMQLLTNLQGEDGPNWLEALKQMNRKMNPWPASPTPLTDRQIAGLRYLIREMPHPSKVPSKKFTTLARQLAWLLLNNSENMSREVYITEQESPALPKEALEMWVHKFTGIAHNFMHGILAAMGTDFEFRFCYGSYAKDGTFDNTGQFPGAIDQCRTTPHPYDAPCRYTFWLARKNRGERSQGMTEIQASLDDIEAIDLAQDGLWPWTGKGWDE